MLVPDLMESGTPSSTVPRGRGAVPHTGGWSRGSPTTTTATAGAQQRERRTEQQQFQLCTLPHNLFYLARVADLPIAVVIVHNYLLPRVPETDAALLALPGAVTQRRCSYCDSNLRDPLRRKSTEAAALLQ